MYKVETNSVTLDHIKKYIRAKLTLIVGLCYLIICHP